MKLSLTKNNKQQGLTLVELMIALALGLILSAGALMMFMGNKETANFQRQFSAIQENGRFATELMMREVRVAGYSGCADADMTDTTNPLSDGSQPPLNFARVVYGYNASGSTWADNNGPGGIDCALNAYSGWTESQCNAGVPDPRVIALSNAGSDILMISSVSSSECRVVTHTGAQPNNNACACSRIKCLGPVSASIKVAGSCDIEDGQILMVSDCKDAAVFQVTNWNSSNGTLVHNTGTGTPGNCTKRLGKLYAPHGSLMEVKQTIFFVDDDASNNNIPTLFRKVNRNNPEALISNVENFQVRFGEGSDGVVTNYRTADSVLDWENVYSVRFDMVVRSENDNVLNSLQTYTFDLDGNGTPESIKGDPLVNSDTGNDLRLRKVFSTTVGVRNRLP